MTSKKTFVSGKKDKNTKSEAELKQEYAYIDNLLAEYISSTKKGLDPADIPLRIYLSSDSEVVLKEVRESSAKIVGSKSYLSKLAVRGSWFQEIVLRIRAIGENKSTQQNVKKAKKILELNLHNRKQAEVDKAQSEAAAALIASLSDVDEAVIQIGSLALVKRKTDNGSAVGVISLTIDQLVSIQENPSVLESPSVFYEQFNSRTDDLMSLDEIRRG